VTPQRELRYYASIPKMLLLLLVSGIFVFIGWQMLRTHRASMNLIIAWLAIGFFGLGVVAFLAMLAFAILRIPLLAIDTKGITARQPLMPWKRVFVPWPDIARIGIRTQRGFHGSSFSMFQAQARGPSRYSSRRAQRFVAGLDPTLLGVVISVPFGFLFVWASRNRRVSLLNRVYQTFAPEIIQYGAIVDEAEQVV
jgi:hypothetical protein